MLVNYPYIMTQIRLLYKVFVHYIPETMDVYKLYSVSKKCQDRVANVCMYAYTCTFR